MESISVTTFSRFVASELAVLDHEFFSSTKLILDCEEFDEKACYISHFVYFEHCEFVAYDTF